MTSFVEKDFLRLVMMVHEIVLPVCKDYFQTNVLGKTEYNGDLKTFLNKHKHDIYHLVHNDRCCQCGNLSSSSNNNNNNRLFSKQFDKFYAATKAREQGHAKWLGRKIIQHCICMYTIVETSSVDDMDISMVNAIIQTCVERLDSSHSMWLNKILEKRNELCHIDDFGRLTTNYTETTWEYLKGSVLGLAQFIPEKSYMAGKEKEIKFLKRVEFQREEVKPILESMKKENEMMKKSLVSLNEHLCHIDKSINGLVKAVPQQTEKVQEYIADTCRILTKENETSTKEIQSTVLDAKEDITEQIGAQAVITSSRITESTDSIKETIKEENKKTLQEVMKALQHTNQNVNFNVNLTEQDPNVDKGTDCPTSDEIIVTWSISKQNCTVKEKAEILQNMRKVEQMAAVWLPYKFEYSGCGSIVIGTLLNKDVYEDKEMFESSVRKFLDRFLVISGIDCTTSSTIDVKIIISKKTLDRTVYKEEAERLLAKYFDKVHQVVPEMLEESSEGVSKPLIELPIVYSLEISVGHSKGFYFLLIFDKSDIKLTEQIVQLLHNDLQVVEHKLKLREVLNYQTRGGHMYLSHILSGKTIRQKVYAMVADTHSKRTAIKVSLELLECNNCIALVPSDGLRYNDISTESIVIDEDRKWKEKLITDIETHCGLIYRRCWFVPFIDNAYRTIDVPPSYLFTPSIIRKYNASSVLIMSSISDHDKIERVFNGLRDYIGHNFYIGENALEQVFVNDRNAENLREETCILVISHKSEFLTRTINLLKPIVVSFSTTFDGPAVVEVNSDSNALWLHGLLSRIVERNKKLPCSIKSIVCGRKVWFYSLMKDKDVISTAIDQLDVVHYRHMDDFHRFQYRTVGIVTLLSGDTDDDEVLLKILSTHDKEKIIRRSTADVPHKSQTKEMKAFADDLMSEIRRKVTLENTTLLIGSPKETYSGDSSLSTTSDSETEELSEIDFTMKDKKQIQERKFSALASHMKDKLKFKDDDVVSRTKSSKDEEVIFGN